MIQLELYTQEIFNFLKTVTIKCDWFSSWYLKNRPLYGAWVFDGTDEEYTAHIVADNFYVTLTGANIDLTKLQPKMAVSGAGIQTSAYIVSITEENGYPILKLSRPPTATGDVVLTIGTPLYKETLNSYYMNLCGEYTEYDTPMYLTSLDTNTEILLTIDNLKIHKQTAEALYVGSQLYDRLCKNYSNQVDLIKSIVYPITLTAAEKAAGSTVRQKVENAKHLTLLNYDSSILQTQERNSIINAIEMTLNYLRTRWAVNEFTVEEHFAGAFWSMLWYHLIMVIHTQRVKNIRTNMVHSYHIWEYLASKGLDNYRNLLSFDQSMYLYRNINYLIRNKGKTSNLGLLANALLSPFRVNLKSKYIVDNTYSTLDTCKKIPEILSKDITKITTPINDASDGVETISDIFIREHDEKLEPFSNDVIITQHSERLSHAKHTSLPTKLVEINKLAMDDRFRIHYIEFFMHSYAYELKYGDMSNISETITVPLAGNNLVLDPLSGLRLLHYVMCRMTNVEPVNLPTVFDARRVIRANLDPTTLPTEFFHPNLGWKKISDYVDVELVRSQIKRFKTTFETTAEFLAEMDTRFGYLRAEILKSRAQSSAGTCYALAALYDKLLVNEHVTLPTTTFTTFSQWFATDKALKTVVDFYNTSEDDSVTWSSFGELLMKSLFPVEQSIFSGSGGLSSEQYLRMKQLFAQLCSYNIAFLDTNRAIKSYFVSLPWRNSSKSSVLSTNFKVRLKNRIRSSERTYTTTSRMSFGRSRMVTGTVNIGSDITD